MNQDDANKGASVVPQGWLDGGRELSVGPKEGKDELSSTFSVRVALTRHPLGRLSALPSPLGQFSLEPCRTGSKRLERPIPERVTAKLELT